MSRKIAYALILLSIASSHTSWGGKLSRAIAYNHESLLLHPSYLAYIQRYKIPSKKILNRIILKTDTNAIKKNKIDFRAMEALEKNVSFLETLEENTFRKSDIENILFHSYKAYAKKKGENPKIKRVLLLLKKHIVKASKKIKNEHF